MVIQITRDKRIVEKSFASEGSDVIIELYNERTNEKLQQKLIAEYSRNKILEAQISIFKEAIIALRSQISGSEEIIPHHQMTDKEATEIIKEFLKAKKIAGVHNIDILDISITLALPIYQVSRIMRIFEQEGLVSGKDG